MRVPVWTEGHGNFALAESLYEVLVRPARDRWDLGVTPRPDDDGSVPPCKLDGEFARGGRSSELDDVRRVEVLVVAHQPLQEPLHTSSVE